MKAIRQSHSAVPRSDMAEQWGTHPGEQMGKARPYPESIHPGRVGKGANSPSESPGWVTAGANSRGVALRNDNFTALVISEGLGFAGN
jgi:hypothetical protein